MILSSSDGLVSANAPAHFPEHLGWAITAAVITSLILAAVEIDREVKKTFICCLIPQSLFYALLLILGNVISTLLAALPVRKLDSSLAPYYWLFSAFFGVFAFETILKNTNVTVLDKGVLTIQDWIKKALTGAAAAAVLRDVRLRDKETGRLAASLSQVSEGQLNAFLAIKLSKQIGDDIVLRLDAAAATNKANSMLYKAYAVASAVPRSEVLAFLAQIKSSTPG
jgi:hypothetical protein